MMSDKVRGLSEDTLTDRWTIGILELLLLLKKFYGDGGWVKIAIIESGLGSDLEIWVQEKILDDLGDICS